GARGQGRRSRPGRGNELEADVCRRFTGGAGGRGGLRLAVSRKCKGGKPEFPGIGPGGCHSPPDFGGINFGVGFIPDEESGYVYGYGHRYSQDSAQNDMYVSRFPASNPAALREFFHGQAPSRNYIHAPLILQDTHTPTINQRLT